MNRMRYLMELGKVCKLTNAEKTELQVLFIRLARQDVRILHGQSSVGRD